MERRKEAEEEAEAEAEAEREGEREREKERKGGIQIPAKEGKSNFQHWPMMDVVFEGKTQILDIKQSVELYQNPIGFRSMEFRPE